VLIYITINLVFGAAFALCGPNALIGSGTEVSLSFS